MSPTNGRFPAVTCKLRRSATHALLGVALLSLSSHAQADEDGEPRAAKLFEEGRRLAREGRCGEAVPILLDSVRRAEGVGAHLNLGHCMQTLGRTASAYHHFKRAVELADAYGDARKAEATERARALVASLSTLTIHVTDAREQGLELRLDDERLETARWGTPLPVDPGPHQLEVVSKRRDRSVLRVVVRSDGDRASLVVPSAPEPTGEHVGAPLSVTSPGSTQRTVAYVIGGVGVASVAVGSIFGVLSLSKHQSLLDRCPTYPNCDAAARPELEDRNSSALTTGNIATVGVVAGAVLLVTGVVVLLTAPRSPAVTATR